VSKRNAGRRGRPRKRRSTATADGGEDKASTGAGGAGGELAAPAPSSQRRDRRSRGTRDPQAGATLDRSRRDPGGVGERPQAPWHPWPFSELLIFVGAIGTIVGFSTRSPATLYASLGAVLLGTLEFTIREHRTGYRSHAALLAAVPTALVHGALAFLLSAAGASRPALVLAPLAVDVPIFFFLYRYLRAQFDDARRERVFALRRR
jgi:hypothetical protein